MLPASGKWLDVNGEAIDETRRWIKQGEGSVADAAAEAMVEARAAGFEGGSTGKI